jgi:hypothetical protein
MLEFLPFIVFGVAFVALVVWLTLKSRQAKAAQARKLEHMGFTPCHQETGTLVERVTSLENNSEYRYRIENPLGASFNGSAVYFYTKSRHRQGHIVAADEFLFPLKRPSEQGLLLFVKPTEVPDGTATTLIGAVATGAWDSQPDDLTKLEIPVELRGTNLIGVLGPAGTSLYDLFDTRTLPLVQKVGDAGALSVMCRGEWCSLSSPSARMPLDLDRIVPIIRELV